MTKKKIGAVVGGAAGVAAVVVLLTGVTVLQSEVTRDGKYRVELADHRVHTPSVQVYEMFSVRLPDGAPVKIGKLTTNAEDCTTGFVVSSDSKRAVYSQQNTALGTDRALYSATVDNSLIPGKFASWELISQVMLNGGGFRQGSLKLRDDGTWVEYWANPLGFEERHYKVSVYGGRIYEFVFNDGFESGNTNTWSGVVK